MSGAARASLDASRVGDGWSRDESVLRWLIKAQLTPLLGGGETLVIVKSFCLANNWRWRWF